jgi:hypothetical protein
MNTKHTRKKPKKHFESNKNVKCWKEGKHTKQFHNINKSCCVYKGTNKEIKNDIQTEERYVGRGSQFYT